MRPILLLLLLPATLLSQNTATWGPINLTARYEYRLMNPSQRAARGITVYLPLPHPTPRQEIHYLHLSHKGYKRTFTDQHGQRLAEYHFEHLAPGACVDVGHSLGVTLSNLRWIDAAESPAPGGPRLSPEERQRYLRGESNYSLDSRLMQGTAEKLCDGAATDFQKLRQIHDYVTSQIRYVRDDQWDTAAQVLMRRSGSCSEYNYLLSGLCRLADLPTRCVGGSTWRNAPLPCTDTVFHRWTEVFLDGIGWFPVDCSRGANPVRGKWSYFGRTYNDVLVWCRQAGGPADYLSWDYRAQKRLEGRDPGLRSGHRTRWFSYLPEAEVEQAYAWFLRQSGKTPSADALECALLRWDQAGEQQQRRAILALAKAGRSESLRRAAALPKPKALLRRLTAETSLAKTLAEAGRQPHLLRILYRKHEKGLQPTADGRFRLHIEPSGTPVLETRKAQIWTTLMTQATAQLARQLEKRQLEKRQLAVACLPIADYTQEGLGERADPLRRELEVMLEKELGARLVDVERFERELEKHGLGRGEYWALAMGRNGNQVPGKEFPPGVMPEVVIAPVLITEQARGQNRHVLDLKVLVLEGARYSKVVVSYEKQAQ